MKCERLREELYEYLDGALSPSEMKALRDHLEACADCREMVAREKEYERSMTRRFQEAVDGIQLEEHVRQRVVGAVGKGRAETGTGRVFSFWKRLAFPLTAAGALAAAIILAGHRPSSPDQSKNQAAQLSLKPGNREISVHVMYCVPSYTFHRDGNTVVDALSCDPQVAEEHLVVKD